MNNILNDVKILYDIITDFEESGLDKISPIVVEFRELLHKAENILKLGNKIEGKQKLSLVVTGDVNSGKSSLINALLNEDILPTGIIDTTKQLFKVYYGPRKKYHDKTGKEIKKEDLNKGNYDSLFYSHPAEVLSDIDLIDTPGISTLAGLQTDISDTVRKADIILFMHDCNKGGVLAQNERDFVQQLDKKENFSRKLLLVMSRYDETQHYLSLQRAKEDNEEKHTFNDVISYDCVEYISDKAWNDFTKELKDYLYKRRNQSFIKKIPIDYTDYVMKFNGKIYQNIKLYINYQNMQKELNEWIDRIICDFRKSCEINRDDEYNRYLKHVREFTKDIREKLTARQVLLSDEKKDKEKLIEGNDLKQYSLLFKLLEEMNKHYNDKITFSFLHRRYSYNYSEDSRKKIEVKVKEECKVLKDPVKFQEVLELIHQTNQKCEDFFSKLKVKEERLRDQRIQKYLEDFKKGTYNILFQGNMESQIYIDISGKIIRLQKVIGKIDELLKIRG